MVATKISVGEAQQIEVIIEGVNVSSVRIFSEPDLITLIVPDRQPIAKFFLCKLTTLMGSSELNSMQVNFLPDVMSK